MRRWRLPASSLPADVPPRNGQKEPIAPGASGNIKITYDPKGRPGPFSKTISVYSNGKTGSFILTIRGEVI